MDANDITDQLYRDVFEVAPFGIYTLDGEGRITSFNPKMAELSGDMVDQVIGLNALEMESYKKVGLDEYFRRGLAGEPFETEVRYESQLGKKVSDRSYRGVPIADRGITGQSRLLLIVEDITERKQILADLESYADFPRQNNNPVMRMNAEGQITVKNRMVDVLIEAWQAASDGTSLDRIKATAAKVIASGKRDRFDVPCGDKVYMFDVAPGGDRDHANVYGYDMTRERRIQNMKDHFLNVASHELRTPMTIIGGYADLLLSGDTGELNEKQQEYIKKIDINTKKLLGFVNNVLDINKLESGKFNVMYEKVDISRIARQAADDMRTLYGQSKVQLSVEIDEPQMVLSDAVQLGRIVTNLLTNSLKFTPSGGRVWLRTYRDGNEAVVEIGDTGVGISSEDQPKLFHKYTQTSVPALHKMESTGLGLVICRELVEEMHGRIWVESQRGHGARFFVAMPVAG